MKDFHILSLSKPCWSQWRFSCWSHCNPYSLFKWALSAGHKHTYLFFSSSKTSSWPSAFTVTSAWSGCCVQETECLLRIHHNYEHIHKYKLETAADLNHPLPSSCLRPGVMRKGRDAPQRLPAPGTLPHLTAEPGMLLGCCTWAGGTTWCLRSEKVLRQGNKSCCWSARGAAGLEELLAPLSM